MAFCCAATSLPQQEGEAYMGEIESVGQAYEDMQVRQGGREPGGQREEGG